MSHPTVPVLSNNPNTLLPPSLQTPNSTPLAKCSGIAFPSSSQTSPSSNNNTPSAPATSRNVSLALGMRGLPDCTIENDAPADRISHILKCYEGILTNRSYHHLGYPYNLDFDYSVLHKLVEFSINNLGDPFIASNYGVHSRPFEVAVLKWFAKLWKIPEEEFWGYITSCGTEGNLHGIWLGREMMSEEAPAPQLADASPTDEGLCSTVTPATHHENVVLIGSRACHYSVWKAGRMYGMGMQQLKTLENDEVDYEDLTKKLKLLKAANKRIVMILNCGTTVRGAVDDISKVGAAFADAGYTAQKDCYVHVDGALFGTMMPFLSDEVKEADASLSSFANPLICSMSASGHKFVGSPVPCGILMTRLGFISKLSQDIAYLNSRDATILGSRNGHAPLFLWYAIIKKGEEGFKADTKKCMENAIYMVERLKLKGVQRVSLNRLSSTVVFARPKSHEFILKWQLACENDIAHVIVMPNVDKGKIDGFVEDLTYTISLEEENNA